MFKLAGKVIDMYDDPAAYDNLHVAYLMAERHIPTQDELKDLPDECFAVKLGEDASDRRYPIHTKVACELSMAYFRDHQNELPPEARLSAGWHIKVAAAAHDIDAPDFSCFAPAPRTPDLDPVGTFVPLDKLAERHEEIVLEKFASLTPQDRSAVAGSFLDTHGAEAFTRKELWDYAPKTKLGSEFDRRMDDRMVLLKNGSGVAPQAVSVLKEMAKTASPMKMIKTIELFDEMSGLDAYYGNGLYDPYRTCYADDLPVKEAAHVPLIEFDADANLIDHLNKLATEYPRGSAKFNDMAERVRNSIADFSDNAPEDVAQAVRLHFSMQDTDI